MKTDLEEVDEILRELEDTAHGREGQIITHARKILQKLISEPPPKDAEKELLRENQKALFSELKEANEYLTTLKVPTNGVDANGNLGYGKRENLTLKQRLTYLQLKNTTPKEEAVEKHCTAGAQYTNCDIHHDSPKGCLSCGNYL